MTTMPVEVILPVLLALLLRVKPLPRGAGAAGGACALLAGGVTPPTAAAFGTAAAGRALEVAVPPLAPPLYLVNRLGRPSPLVLVPIDLAL